VYFSSSSPNTILFMVSVGLPRTRGCLLINGPFVLL
jgi:hypothetical protein